MALCESPYRGSESVFSGSLAFPMTPPFANTCPTSSTPLMLPRDWPEDYCITSTSEPSLAHNYDFQSNHLETSRLPPEVIPSLAGLGIRNVDLDTEVEIKSLKLPAPIIGNLSLMPMPMQDSRRHHRISRTDSVYDVAGNCNSANATNNQHVIYDLGLCSPWTFSSILRAAEFSASNATSDLGRLLVSGELSEPSTSSQLLDGLQSPADGEEDLNLSFEKLSAATGLSVADFAAHISATAEATLKRMGADLDVSSSSVPLSGAGSGGQLSFMTTYNGNNESLTWPPLSCETILPLPFVDINLRESTLSWNDCVGVDPSNILPNSQSSLSHLTQHIGDSSSSNFSDSIQPAPPILAPVAPQTSYTNHSEHSSPIPKRDVSSPPQELYTLPFLKHTSRDARQASDDDAFQSPSSSEYSPCLQPLGSKRNNNSRPATRRAARQADPETPSLDYPKDIDQQHLPPINLGTPVFDAHRGIDIEELKAKAERYRLRNQGRDYDKRWLISFAGKLSERGELVEEFRCYVAGCKQVNKRRDHILIHVGAHLDQRPFKCLHCSARFLRKNECKRHELSHTGVRPFSCHLCPVPATTFVRQDLLKRHMKRTHRLELKIEKENEEPPRPRKRTKI